MRDEYAAAFQRGWMQLSLILRRPRSGRLEGRIAPIQRPLRVLRASVVFLARAAQLVVIPAKGLDYGTPEKGLETLNELLKKATPGGPENVVLIYLSAHGIVNEKNEPCLLLARSKPEDPKTWLPLAKVLEALREYKKGTSVKKVLVLDCNRMDFNWSWGLLHNSFAERLRELVDKEPNLVVINSTSPGQIGWAAPELGSSVFGHFFMKGLNGAAAPIAITTALPPGFTSPSLSIFQLLVIHTFPDGSI